MHTFFFLLTPLFLWEYLLTFLQCSLPASQWLSPNISEALLFHLLTNWLLRNPDVHYRRYINSPLIPIFSKIYPISMIMTYLLQIHLILSSHLWLGLPKGLFRSGFPTKILYAFLDSFIRSTHPAHLSLDIKFLIISAEEYIAFSWALCTLLHSP